MIDFLAFGGEKRRGFSHSLVSLVSTAFLLFSLGCSSMHGTYADREGSVTIKFQGDKALVTLPMGTTTELKYRMDGDNIVLEGPGGNMVLTREKDGSLGGSPLGEPLVKQRN